MARRDPYLPTHRETIPAAPREWTDTAQWVYQDALNQGDPWRTAWKYAEYSHTEEMRHRRDDVAVLNFAPDY